MNLKLYNKVLARTIKTLLTNKKKVLNPNLKYNIEKLNSSKLVLWKRSTLFKVFFVYWARIEFFLLKSRKLTIFKIKLNYVRKIFL